MDHFVSSKHYSLSGVGRRAAGRGKGGRARGRGAIQQQHPLEPASDPSLDDRNHLRDPWSWTAAPSTPSAWQVTWGVGGSGRIYPEF